MLLITAVTECYHHEWKFISSYYVDLYQKRNNARAMYAVLKVLLTYSQLWCDAWHQKCRPEIIMWQAAVGCDAVYLHAVFACCYVSMTVCYLLRVMWNQIQVPQWTKRLNSILQTANNTPTWWMTSQATKRKLGMKFQKIQLNWMIECNKWKKLRHWIKKRFNLLIQSIHGSTTQ